MENSYISGQSQGSLPQFNLGENEVLKSNSLLPQVTSQLHNQTAITVLKTGAVVLGIITVIAMLALIGHYVPKLDFFNHIFNGVQFNLTTNIAVFATTLAVTSTLIVASILKHRQIKQKLQALTKDLNGQSATQLINQSFHDENQTLKQQNKTSTKEITELTSENQRLKSDNQRYESSKDELDKIQSFKEQIANMRAENETLGALNARLQHDSTQVTVLNEELAIERQAIAGLRTELQKTGLMVQTLKDELANKPATDKPTDMEKINKQLQFELSELIKVNSDLHTEITTLEKKITDVETENNATIAIMEKGITEQGERYNNEMKENLAKTLDDEIKLLNLSKTLQAREKLILEKEIELMSIHGKNSLLNEINQASNANNTESSKEEDQPLVTSISSKIADVEKEYIALSKGKSVSVIDVQKLLQQCESAERVDRSDIQTVLLALIAKGIETVHSNEEKKTELFASTTDFATVMQETNQLTESSADITASLMLASQILRDQQQNNAKDKAPSLLEQICNNTLKPVSKASDKKPPSLNEQIQNPPALKHVVANPRTLPTAFETPINDQENNVMLILAKTLAQKFQNVASTQLEEESEVEESWED